MAPRKWITDVNALVIKIYETRLENTNSAVQISRQNYLGL